MTPLHVENKLAKQNFKLVTSAQLCLYNTSETSWKNKNLIILTVKMTQIMAGLLVSLFFFFSNRIK